MNNEKREIRTLACQLSVRELAPNEKGESRTITGTAIVFNSESEVLDDWGYRFREVIKPEACSMEWLNTQDIKMNMLHDRSLTVARCNKGQGSLRLSVDDKGVNFEFEAPKCDIGDRCLEMVKRGDYSGCSFEFFPDKFDISEENGKEAKITHTRFASITALTIGLDPAYTATSVNARELVKHDDEEEKAKAEREAKEAEEKAKREADEEAKRKAEEERLVQLEHIHRTNEIYKRRF